ncbi:hypothetical protein FALBO_8349 [Fusarium albosuccineum]|uniref:Uncharacterized protein n=1 Tax=Fusarium albosuccineum TaxID=1237068 RepID=A0A8H4P707_9HYPO|nr:hypothetical protein FALBO_8349 [Fusarium albosuccineum]
MTSWSATSKTLTTTTCSGDDPACLDFGPFVSRETLLSPVAQLMGLIGAVHPVGIPQSVMAATSTITAERQDG